MRFAAITAAVTIIAGSGAVSTRATADGKADEVLVAARKAIGGGRLETLKTLAVEATVRRNVNTMQLTSAVEILLELPDKYVRSETPTGGMMGGSTSMGFNGDTPIRPANSASLPGGGIIIRMEPGGPIPAAEKLTPADQERADKQMVRGGRAEASRLMLGWMAAAHPSLQAQYTYAGEAESPDGRADVIDVRNGDGFTARLFIDQQTKLPLMVTYQGAPPRMISVRGPRGGGPGRPDAGDMTPEERTRAREEAEKRLHEMQQDPPQPVEMTLYFDDWREENGIRFPHTMRRAVSGTTNEEWTIEKVRVNPRIDAKKFEG